jgi:apolipoprotein N-acyltransferase
MTDTDFIVTQTNNATYFKTWQLEQELAIAQARSAETSRQSAYVSTTGVTAIVDERGKIQKSIPKYENQTLVENIYVRSGATPAAKYGNIIEMTILLLLLFSFTLRLKSQLRFKRDLINP